MIPLFKFFAERHKLATLFSLMVIMLGVSAFLGIKRDIYPQVDFGMVSIVTRYPGASPEDVELNVTNKIEEELKSVTDIEKVTSISVENVSAIIVTIDIDASDQDDIKNKIREAVGRVTEFPPEVTDSPTITELNTGMMDVIEVGLSGDVPYKELREQARLLEKKIKNVSGVSRVDQFGYRSREIKIEISPDAVDQYQIPLREVITAIRGRNIRGTTGSFESYTSEKNLVTLAQFKDPFEVNEVIVRSSFDGPAIKVSDLAEIKDEFEDERIFSRLNGKKSISYLVFISEKADAIRTCDEIKDLVEKEKEILPKDIEIIHINDESRYVRDSFDVVLSNGWIGLILVVILLTIFLNFRTAFWVALGIPVTLLGTVFLLPAFGMYLDTITLSGMLLVIGIIVDDAIIIAENIAQRREKGDNPLDASVNGIKEVYQPVITTILTTFIVFAPMFFMPGLFGKYIVPIPLAITLALFISLCEVTIALPAHLVPGLKKKPPKSTKHNWFSTVRDKYRHLLKRLLRFRYIIVPVFIIALVGSIWFAGNFIKFILFPSEQSDSIFLFVELPTGSSLEATSDKVREIEEIISTLPDEELASFNSRIGANYSEIFVMAESENYAAMRIRLTPFSERKRNAVQIVENLRIHTDKIKGVDNILYNIESGGPPVGKPVNIRIVGSDNIMREKLADSIQSYLGTIEGVKDISSDDKPGKDQVNININYDELARLGLTVADVARNVRIAYDGEIVTSVRYGDEEVDFRIIMQEEARKNLDYLNEVKIPNNRNRLIPLKRVASLSSGPGPSDYRHYDGERTITVEADIDIDQITALEVTNQVFAFFDVERNWKGMQLGVGGEAFETEESMASLFRTFVIAIIAIYFLLVILFNSFSQPFLVMAAIPFGVTGVIIAYGIHGEPFSFMAVLGIVGLSGVVVNDSLVMVSHMNNLKQTNKDSSILEVVAEGASNRLRAVVLTTLTTVAALLPLAYGIGGTAVFMAPMALSLGWGLLFATPLTLLLLPSLYLIGDDLKRLFTSKK